MSTLSIAPPPRKLAEPGMFRDGQAFPEMVLVPAGEFLMGAEVEQDKFASLLEMPRHVVRVASSFAIGRHPVTFAQWDAFADAVPHTHRPSDHGWGRGDLPVVDVSWDDAKWYTDWLSRKTGRGYRLCSEAEWEYCCRAGSDHLFATGPTLTTADANFLYLDFGDAPGLGHPSPVGSYPPNAFGLFDMHGNVCELIEDGWHDTYAGAPADGSPWEANANNPWRVVRGGGWDAMPRVLRCAFRDWLRRDQRLDNVGFRVACSLMCSA